RSWERLHGSPVTCMEAPESISQVLSLSSMASAATAASNSSLKCSTLPSISDVYCGNCFPRRRSWIAFRIRTTKASLSSRVSSRFFKRSSSNCNLLDELLLKEFPQFMWILQMDDDWDNGITD
ncbi:hypothetical protein R1flu_008743, partial [Riccia fluitans]